MTDERGGGRGSGGPDDVTTRTGDTPSATARDGTPASATAPSSARAGGTSTRGTSGRGVRTRGAPARSTPRGAQSSRAKANGATAISATRAAGATNGGRLVDKIPKAPDNVREFFSRRPTVGPGPAAQSVVTDISDLVKAEVALAKAEFTQKATEKGMGLGLFVGAAVAGWLALQGLLITAGFVIALFLPGWAAALIVSAVLLVVAAVLALVGKKKFSTPLGLDTTKDNVQEDVAWAKAHLNGPAKT